MVLLTDNGFYVLFRTRYATFRFESGASTECKRKGIVVVAEIVVNLASKQSRRVSRFLWQVFALV